MYKNGALFSDKEEWNYVVCMKMNATGDHPVEWNKSNWERQISMSLSEI
jgi:hypothetical protein